METGLSRTLKNMRSTPKEQLTITKRIPSCLEPFCEYIEEIDRLAEQLDQHGCKPDMWGDAVLRASQDMHREGEHEKGLKMMRNYMIKMAHENDILAE